MSPLISLLIAEAPTEVMGNDLSSIEITDTRVQASPRILGNFELLGELGRGGMGVVYKARQLNPDRMVALKMILTGSYAAAGFRRRFEIEAEAVGNLRHPNIVSLYESGEIDGNLYYTMPLIEGTTLSDAENGKWHLRESVELMKKLADAIAHAHQRGILHRDLKPSNILLDKEREPFITDFGLAKITDRDSSSDMTMTGDVMGSPGYMAPEQALGRTHDISMATDVYGLGVIMYQVVTGHPPFRGETVAELLQQVIHTEPARPKSALGRVDRDLSTICLRCMEKEPKARYASAADLADDLQRWLDGEPIKARAVGLAERSWKWMRRNPLLAAFLLTTVVLSSVAVIGIESQRRLYRDQRAKYLEQLLDAKLQHAEAELEKGFRGRALAHYAKILSIDPDHRIARERIVEQQHNGVFARALHPPIRTGIKIDDAARQLAVSPDGRTVYVGDTKGTGWLVVGTDKQELNVGRDPWYPELSRDGEWLLVSLKSEGVKIWSTQTREVLSTLPQTIHARIAIHPEKQAIATLDRRRVILKLWDPIEHTAQRLEWKTRPRTLNQRHFRWDPTGRYVLANSYRRVGVWDAQTGEQVLDFDEPGWGKNPESCAFSRDGRLLAWGGGFDLGRVFDLQSGDVLAELPQTHTIAGIDFNHDGTLVATGGKDRRAVVWESRGGKVVNEFPHEDTLFAVKFDESGRFLLTVANNRTIHVWDVAANRRHADRIVFTSPVLAAGFSSGSDKIFTICQDGTIHRFALPAKTDWFKLDGTARMVDFAPSADELIVAGSDGANNGGFHWRAGGDGLKYRFAHTGYTPSIAFSPDGGHVAVWGETNAVRGWTRNADGGWPEEFRSAAIRKNEPLAAFSPDGGMLVTAEAYPLSNEKTPGQIKLWSTAGVGAAPGELAPLRTNFMAEFSRVERLVFSPDNKHFAIGDRKKIELWSVDQTNSVHRLEENVWLEWLEFSPDGKLLAGALHHGEAMIWNVETGRRHVPALAHHGRVNCIVFSPDGTLVLSAADDKTAQIWSVATGKPVGQPVEHTERITRVAFSPKGDRFATISDDFTARVWDLETRKPLSAPMVHGALVYHLDFNRDGRRLATTARNGEVRIWNVESPAEQTSSEQLIELARELGRHQVLEDGRVVRIPW